MQKKFDILFRQRIPFLTRGSWALIVGFFLILLLLWIFMIPAANSQSSLEMKTAYYILAVPDWVKYLSAFSVIGLLVLLPLNSLRFRIPSILSIFENSFSIQNKRINITVQFASIKRVFVSDLTNYRGQSKFILQIAITLKYNKLFAFSLVNYGDLNELIESLSRLDADKFTFSDKKMSVLEDEI